MIQPNQRIAGLLALLATTMALFAASEHVQAQQQQEAPSLPDYNIAGFMENQFTYDGFSGDPASFSIYRARAGFAGQLTERISVNLIAGALEPPDRNPQLVNAFVDFSIDPTLQLRAGQFLVPFGLEGPEPIFLNPAIERSLAVRRMNPLRMFRDIGLQVSGAAESVNYAVALTNGVGANLPDRLDAKDIMGRIGWTPVEALQIGVSGHMGWFEAAGGSDQELQRLRLGLDGEYRMQALRMRGEYQLRSDEQPGGDDLQQHGGYLLGAYRMQQDWEVLLRLDIHDPDTGSDETELTAITAGLNHYFDGNTRLSVNYEYRDDRAVDTSGGLLLVQMQVAL